MLFYTGDYINVNAAPLQERRPCQESLCIPLENGWINGIPEKQEIADI